MKNKIEQAREWLRQNWSTAPDIRDLTEEGVAKTVDMIATVLDGTAEPALPSEDEALRVYEQAFSGSNYRDRESRRRDGIRAVLDLIRSRTVQPAGTIAASPSDDDIAAAYAAAFAASTANNDPWKHVDAIRAVGEFVRGHAVKPDPPIADPAERARAVARELRRRGIWALHDGCGVVRVFVGNGARDDVYRTNVSDKPRAIADEIQREEARRAAAWAGDEEEREGGR